jgi:hypothetical protein
VARIVIHGDLMGCLERLRPFGLYIRRDARTPGGWDASANFRCAARSSGAELVDDLGCARGWFAADAANVKPGSNVVVVGDGAERIIP